jgi:hypothetical protein
MKILVLDSCERLVAQAIVNLLERKYECVGMTSKDEAKKAFIKDEAIGSVSYYGMIVDRTDALTYFRNVPSAP